LSGDSGEFRFAPARGGLAGWVRKDLPKEICADFMRDPEAFFNDPSARVLKDGLKTKVIQKTFQDRTGASWEMIIKRFHYGFFIRRLGFLVFDSPAVRSLQGALLLRQMGFDTPAPMTALEFRSGMRLGTSYYICEAVRDSHSLGVLWQSVLPAAPKTKRIAVSRSIFRDLARLLSRLHSMGIYHRDLKGSNILVQAWETDRRRFFLVDLDRVAQRALVSRAKRIKNLLQVRRGAWSRKERAYFFMRYAMLSCPSKKDAKEFVRQVLAALRRRRSGRKKFNIAGSR
jgi:hypothetical protein